MTATQRASTGKERRTQDKSQTTIWALSFSYSSLPGDKTSSRKYVGRGERVWRSKIHGNVRYRKRGCLEYVTSVSCGYSYYRPAPVCQPRTQRSAPCTEFPTNIPPDFIPVLSTLTGRNIWISKIYSVLRARILHRVHCQTAVSLSGFGGFYMLDWQWLHLPFKEIMATGLWSASDVHPDAYTMCCVQSVYVVCMY